MAAEIAALRAGNATAREAQHVLMVCDEFTEVLSGVATYTDLNTFVRKTLIPYAQGWQRRAFKIVESVAAAKGVLSAALNRTEALVVVFNNSVAEMLEKTDRKIVRLADLLADDDPAELGIDMEEIARVAEQPVYVRLMKAVALGEVAAVVLFYFVQGIPAVRRVLLEL